MKNYFQNKILRTIANVSLIFAIVSLLMISCNKEPVRGTPYTTSPAPPRDTPVVSPPTAPRNIDPATLFPNSTVLGNRSNATYDVSAAICKDKLFCTGNSSGKAYVDVFNLSGGGKVTYELSQSRSSMVAAATDNKVLIAGGFDGTKISSRVDIYDITTAKWTTAELSIARGNMAVASSGNYVFFAGGQDNSNKNSTRVDIYDASNNTWSISELSTARSSFTAAVVGNMVLFAGGQASPGTCMATVDLYNIDTKKWNVDKLSKSRWYTQSVVVDDKVYIVGNTCEFIFNTIVDVYDAKTSTWKVLQMSHERGVMQIGASNGKIAVISGYDSYVSGAQNMEVYNPSENKWTIVPLSSDIVFQSTLSYQNHIYSIGGLVNNENQLIDAVIKFGL